MTLHVFTGVQVLNGALLQQSFVVEFMVHNQMCEDCHRVEAKDYWRSCVQVRQKVCTRCLTFLNGVNIHICIITIRIAHRANRWYCFYSKVEFSFFLPLRGDIVFRVSRGGLAGSMGSGSSGLPTMTV